MARCDRRGWEGVDGVRGVGGAGRWRGREVVGGGRWWGGTGLGREDLRVSGCCMHPSVVACTLLLLHVPAASTPLPSPLPQYIVPRSEIDLVEVEKGAHTQALAQVDGSTYY